MLAEKKSDLNFRTDCKAMGVATSISKNAAPNHARADSDHATRAVPIYSHLWAAYLRISFPVKSLSDTRKCIWKPIYTEELQPRISTCLHILRSTVLVPFDTAFRRAQFTPRFDTTIFARCIHAPPLECLCVCIHPTLAFLPPAHVISKKRAIHHTCHRNNFLNDVAVVDYILLPNLDLAISTRPVVVAVCAVRKAY
jgi:hypothetical protein